jgi:hypothetical protein
LKGTRDEGLLLDPKEHSFQVVADADHSDQSANDEATAKSRTGYVIKHAGCPVVWHSKLQTEIALSSIEAEHVCLRESLRDTVPMMQLIKEIQDCGFKVPTATPVVQCRLFDDNLDKIAPAHQAHEFETPSFPIICSSILNHHSPCRNPRTVS